MLLPLSMGNGERAPSVRASGHSSIETPGTSAGVSDLGVAGSSVGDESSLLIQWREAQQRCYANLALRDREKKRILSFARPKDLLDDIECDERFRNHAVLRSHLAASITPFLHKLADHFGILVAMLPSRSITMNLLLGCIYFALKGASEEVKIFEKMAEITRLMKEKLQAFSSSIPPGISCQSELEEVIGEALLDMFIALIEFWADAMEFLRGPYLMANLSRRWPPLQRKFNITMRRLHDSVDRMQSFVQNSWRHNSDAVRHQNESFLTMMNLEEESQTSFPCYILDACNQLFGGREQELGGIMKHLTAEDAAQNLNIYVIHGLGGTGKSSLALAYAHESQKARTYDAIFWVHAYSAPAFRESFDEIAVRLDFPRASKKGENINNNVNLVKNWLAKTKKRWLLIYDNVEQASELNEFFPPSHGSMIITTRYPTIAPRSRGRTARCLLGGLGEQEAQALFDRVRSFEHPSANPQAENEEKKVVLDQLGGLALGIVQMASYIGRRRLTIKAFLADYNKMSARIDDKRDDLTDYPHSLSTVWEMHFVEMRENHPRASLLLSIFAILSPSAIPIKILVPEEACAGGYVPFCSEEDRDEVEEAIDRLMERSLVQREGENISLHRLVQQAFRRSNFKYRPEARQEAYNAAVTLLNYYFPKMGGASSLYDQWATCEELLNHSLALADLVLNDRTHKKSFESSPELEELLKNSAWYQYEIGALRESQQLLKIAMNICRDKSSLLYAQLCNNLGVIYFDWNDLFECKKHLQECLSIRVSLLEPNHIELANIYSNLAGMHAADGNLDEALRLYTMCDDIRSQTPTEGYYYRGLTLMCIGRVHLLQRRFELAESFFHRSEKFIVDGPKILMTLLLFAIGNLELARDNTTRATQKFEDADTQKLDSAPKAQLLKCAIQYKIGFCKAKLGQFHEAIENFDCALIIAKYRQAPGHIARILHQKSLAIQKCENTTSEELQRAREMAIQASLHKANLSQCPTIESEVAESDSSFDRLVSLYHW